MGLPAVVARGGGPLRPHLRSRYAEPGKILRLVLCEHLAARAPFARPLHGPRRPGSGRKGIRLGRRAGRRIRSGRSAASASAHALEHRLVLRRDGQGGGIGGVGRSLPGCSALPSRGAIARAWSGGNVHDRPEIVEGHPVAVDPQVEAAAGHEPPYRQPPSPVVACTVYGHVRVATADAGRHGRLVDYLPGANLAARVAVPHDRRQLVLGVVGRGRHEVVRPLGHSVQPRHCEDRHAGGPGARRGAPCRRPRRPPRWAPPRMPPRSAL